MRPLVDRAERRRRLTEQSSSGSPLHTSAATPTSEAGTGGSAGASVASPSRTTIWDTSDGALFSIADPPSSGDGGGHGNSAVAPRDSQFFSQLRSFENDGERTSLEFVWGEWGAFSPVQVPTDTVLSSCCYLCCTSAQRCRRLWLWLCAVAAANGGDVIVWCDRLGDGFFPWLPTADLDVARLGVQQAEDGHLCWRRLQHDGYHHAAVHALIPAGCCTYRTSCCIPCPYESAVRGRNPGCRAAITCVVASTRALLVMLF